MIYRLQIYKIFFYIPTYFENRLHWGFKNIYQRFIKRFNIIYFKLITLIYMFKGYFFKIGVNYC